MNQYLNFSLEGKVALVTGASYGIGFAIASAWIKVWLLTLKNKLKHTDMYVMLLTSLPYRLWLPLSQRK